MARKLKSDKLLFTATVLLVFLSRYRESVEGAAAPTPVLVATALIQKGTSGDVLAEKRQFETVTRAAEDIKQGGIADPALLAGKVTLAGATNVVSIVSGGNVDPERVLALFDITERVG